MIEACFGNFLFSVSSNIKTNLNYYVMRIMKCIVFFDTRNNFFIIYVFVKKIKKKTMYYVVVDIYFFIAFKL
jgi:hypothetical protein